MIWLAIASFSGFLFIGLMIWAVSHRIQRQVAVLEYNAKASIETAIREWIESPDSTTPSRLAMFIDTLGATIGSATARSIMASLNAEKSQVAHVANGISDQVQAVQNPLVALLAGGRRGKNSAVMRLAEILGQQFLTRGNGAQAEAPYTKKHHE